MEVPPASPSLQSALDRYMVEHSAVHHRPNTGKRYRQVLGLFIARNGSDLPVAQVTRKRVLEFQRQRRLEAAPDTVNGDLGYLKAFLNWCRAEELIPHDPCFKIRRLRVNRSRRRTLSFEEYGEVMEALKDRPFLHDFSVVAANTGMRPNETLHVRGMDLEAEKGRLHISAWGGWQTKDWEDRTLELNDTALRVLARRKLANGNDALPLFAGKVGTVRDWKNVYHELKKALPERLTWVSLYEFRHFFSTEAARRGWNIERLRLYLGHADLSTTMQYYVNLRAEDIGRPPELALG